MANPNLGAGPGRPKGLANKATLKAREAIAQFVDDNAHRLEGWLDRIADKDPKQAFDCFQSVIEYHIPKLARTEHTGKDGAAIKTERSIPQEDRAILEHYMKTKGK